ncbi:NAD(P)/FAD-dependent oxidoreductase [Saccharopolyspora phatthalungensis]|uniref:Oxygen-dependent protoporphyrinogen oxidase n=1 Tax=Saccharopolyspora phatthalungensis TaxID=664693 RepID=A0A840QED0_9PSEU|nr:NAD(P)/FAD-dependent oxidoreductase [Saccharopolyspora phatthalungensis]MBB5158786.1 oxygen-dependent protoporphyrinogen oxidase [Saccharopolyspora phatthalungensis]
MSTDLDVAVVGAGVAGLTTAHELHRAGLQVRVFEQQDHVGGRMHSLRHDGYTIDEGAEQIPLHGYRATWELLNRLRVPITDVPLIGKSIGMWRDGRAHAGVAEKSAAFSGAGLSPRARLDLVRFLAWSARHRDEFDCDHPERSPLGTATVKEFAARYHRDLHDYLLQPVAGSFFGWNTARSTAAPMVSLLLAVGDVGTWRTYRDGMDLLARRLADGLDVVTGSVVRQVVSDRGVVRLFVGGDVVTARSVVLCVPAPIAARLYANPSGEDSAFLSACTFTPTLKVSCLLDRPLAPESSKPLYVLLTPEAEDDALSGIIVDHAKHPGRAPAGKGLLSLMANARTIPELLQAPEQQVVERLTTAARRYVPGLESACREHFVHSFVHGLPEATPEALHRRARFMARPVGPVEYAGDWVMLRPASEGAVRSGALAAARVRSRLRASQPIVA